MSNLKKAAADALDVQDACNLSGVARRFADALTDVWAEATRLKEGTKFVNQHPISVLFACKIADLAAPGASVDFPSEAFSAAYGECLRLAERNN